MQTTQDSSYRVTAAGPDGGASKAAREWLGELRRFSGDARTDELGGLLSDPDTPLGVIADWVEENGGDRGWASALTAAPATPRLDAAKIPDGLRTYLGPIGDPTRPARSRLDHAASLETVIMDRALNAGLGRDHGFWSNKAIRAYSEAPFMARRALESWAEGGSAGVMAKHRQRAVDEAFEDIRAAGDKVRRQAAGLRHMARSGKGLPIYSGEMDAGVAADVYEWAGDQAEKIARQQVAEAMREVGYTGPGVDGEPWRNGKPVKPRKKRSDAGRRRAPRPKMAPSPAAQERAKRSWLDWLWN